MAQLDLLESTTDGVTPEFRQPDATDRPWAATVAQFRRPDHVRAWWQILNTMVPFCGLWYLMYLSYSQSYWLTLLLAVPAAGLRVRIFIIQHDCGHHSFFHSRRANDLLGFLCGVITLTPYHFWRRAHSRHHAGSGNLHCRGQGDVTTLTVSEYLRLSRFGRFRYRLYRHPLVMFLLGAAFLFVIRHRLTYGIPRTWRRERQSVHATNAAMLAILCLGWWQIGLLEFLLIDAPIVLLGAMIGTWLFYVQHQFEDAYWRPKSSWDFTRSAMDGSSYYRLPPLLQWFTGNIGFHHIHHLNSRIPNYHLSACYEAEPSFRQAVTFGVWESLRCTSLKLWDERSRRLVKFADARATTPGDG